MPLSARSYNLAAPFFAHAQARPSSLALVVDEVSYDYGALAALAGKIGAWLNTNANANANANDGHRVGILAARSLEAYAGILGSCWAGHTYVPINARLPEERLLALLQKARLGALIVDAVGAAALSERLRAAAPAAILGPHDSQLDEISPLAAPVDVGPDSIGYLMFTSGTTGTPKGVMITAGNVAHFVDVMCERYRLSPSDRVLQHAELSFDLSVLPVYLGWASGASLHVVPEAERMSPGPFLLRQRITVWVSTPSVITFMERTRQLGEGAFPLIRVSAFCGEALPIGSAQAWQRATPNGLVDNQYGPTEATCSCMVERLDGAASVTPDRDTVAIGKAYRGMHAALVDGGGAFLPDGMTGELAISGAQVMAGYFDDPELTARRRPTLRHPTLGDSVWYLTGDLASADESGRFHHLGRVDNQVKILGHRIELEEVETHLRQIAGTDAVAAIGWPVESGRVQGIAAFVGACAIEVGEIHAAMKARLPAYMLPRQLIKLDTLPLNANGKVDRKALVELLTHGAHS